MKINDIKLSKSLLFNTQKSIMSFLNDFFFYPLLRTINYTASNANSPIKEALINGEIIYEDGVFKPVKTLSNDLSLHFEKVGAKWDKTLKGYVFKVMPDWLIEEVQLAQRLHYERMVAIDNLLQDFSINIDQYLDVMLFNQEFIEIAIDANKQIRKNVKHINVIDPELTREQLQEIGEAYTNNAKISIKNWSLKSITKMRNEVQSLIMNGWHENNVKKLIGSKYYKEIEKSVKLPKNVNKADLKLIIKKQQLQAKKKAEFIAHNETSRLLAQIKKQLYTQMGFTEFIWKTTLDGRERLEHHNLNNRIFRFDSPPIIDERTGERGLPGETYNCRCTLIPYRRDSVFNGFSAQNWLKSNFDESRIHRNKGKFSKNPNTFVENLEPIIINSNEIKQFKSKDRNKLSQYVLDLFQQNRHLTIKSNNREILLSNNSAKRTSAKQDVNDKKQNAFYLKIKEIIENAHYFDIEKADARHPNVDGQEVYYSKILIDGEPFKVKISVDIPLKKYLDLGATYNFAGHRVSKIELAPARKTLSANNSTGELQQVLILL